MFEFSEVKHFCLSQHAAGLLTINLVLHSGNTISLKTLEIIKHVGLFPHSRSTQMFKLPSTKLFFKSISTLENRLAKRFVESAGNIDSSPTFVPSTSETCP